MTSYRLSSMSYCVWSLYLHLFSCAFINANSVPIATENIAVTGSVTKQTTLDFVSETTNDSSITKDVDIVSDKTITTTIGRASSIENYTSNTTGIDENETSIQITSKEYSSPSDLSLKTQTQSAAKTTQLTTTEMMNTSRHDTLTSLSVHTSFESSTGHLSGGTQSTSEIHDEDATKDYNETSIGGKNSTMSSTIIWNGDTTHPQVTNQTINLSTTKMFIPSDSMHIVIQVVVPGGITLIICLVIIGFVYVTIKREKENTYGLPQKQNVTTKFDRDSYFRRSYIVNPSFGYDEPFDESESNLPSLFSGNSELQRDHKIVMDISQKWTF